MIMLSVIQMKLAVPIPIPIRPSKSIIYPWPARVNALKFSRGAATIAAASFRGSATPARDRVIDFGKYKGRMLGTLPSGYLKWVSENLRAGDTEEWAKLADRVLDDPVYRDRLEWEAADKILSGNDHATSSRRSGVAELLEISERFGWDNEDKIGWSKINFGLLGTSKSGRIPRKNDNNDDGSLKESKNESSSSSSNTTEGGKRRERRERVRRLRAKTTMGEGGDGQSQRETSRPARGGAMLSSGIRFPGREALLKKALNR